MKSQTGVANLLNEVVASVDALANLSCRIFDRLPMAEQPRYLAGLSCGDGFLLRAIFEAIRSRSRRGQALGEYPLRLIGIDTNERALQAAARHLADLPHLLIRAHSEDPQRLFSELSRKGIHDPEQILYLRTFPGRTDDLGKLKRIVSKHGFIQLDTRSPGVENGPAPDHRNASKLFDTSGEQLSEGSVLLMSAAGAGLFPERVAARSWPAASDSTQVTLNRFIPRPYTVRHPMLADLDRLRDLELAAWPENLCATDFELRRRVELIPKGQAVLESDGRLVAALYSQRIKSIDQLFHVNYAAVPQLHDPKGRVAQLLGICVHPELGGRGFADELMDFVLAYFAACEGIENVVGVTRCHHYWHQRESGASHEDYVRSRNEHGRLNEPMLQFHEAHGAVIRAVLPLFRPEDVQNAGAGVLIEYPLRGDSAIVKKEPLHRSVVREDISVVVRESIEQVLGSARTHLYEVEAPLMEMGLSSLQLLELRHLLQELTAKELEPTCFFKWGTPAAIIGHLSGNSELKGAPEKISSLENRESLVTEAVAVPGAPSHEEPIAIVGLGCRFPGNARGPSLFWTLLRNAQNAIAERPLSREQIAGPPGSKTGDLSFADRGGFLDHIDQFDAGFFRISPREADLLDPQHRLLLEIVWESLENAGLAPLSLRGTSTGVFVGMMGRDYEAQIASRGTVEDLSAYFSTGNAPSVAAGRVAYFFDWRGPALTVDTACSSSLVAVHLACQSLHSGECNLAVAAGVNLLMDGKSYLAFRRAGMLASDGHCKTFDAAADGYVRSEGCGVVVLKRLSDAMRDGDRILAVIRGSAVNQDGASTGLTVPNQISQQEVIERAIRSARVAPQEVVYLEAHGTGTSLGDPIEVQAAAAVFGQGRGTDRPLLIGSVKTNIGHLEAAAGIAGLIKVILAMEHKVIPKHLHFQKPNPHIAWERLPVKVTSEATTWPVGRKIAGVSSFGFSGTNAHVIVEEAPEEQRIEKGESERSEHLLVLSARSEEALQQLAGRYVQWLEAKPEAELADVCYSAGVGRSHLGQRAAAVVNSFTEAKELLIKLERGESGGRLYRGQSSKRPKVAWLFTGQGSQYAGMGRELYRNQPVVREVLDRCQELLAQEGGRPLLEVLFEQEGLLNQTRYTQPALFALELALAELWRSWGQEPDVVLGHSVGQYAAAVVAGILSLEEGLRLVAKRGELMGQLPPGGAMAAVFSDLAGLEEVLGQEAELSLAADNGGHLVLSGTEEVLERVLLELRKAGVRSQRLNTSHGFHSKLMEPVLEEFESYARGVKFGTAKVGVVCNLTGDLLGATEASEPRYWRRHLRETVQFSRSIRTVAELGIELLVEVGPQPILLEIAQSCWPQSRPMALKVASMRRGQGETRQIAEAAAQLYVHGLTSDFVGWDRPWPRRKLSLPTYPFQRSRFWISANRQSEKEEVASTISTPPTSNIQELLYEFSWQSSGRSVSASDWVPGCWLLLADRQGWATRIKTFLQDSKQKCQLLYYDEFASPNKLENVLHRLEKGDLPLRQVVHLWSLDLPTESQTAGITEIQRLALISTLQVVQMLARRQSSVPLRLITRGACAVKAGDPVEPFQAPWWGFSKVIGLELPMLRGAMVDLPAAAEVDPDLVGALSRELLHDQEEDYVALRSGGRYVVRLKRLSEHSVAAPLQLSKKASYLITGGLGALGLKTASWLAERGADNLVLVGRRAPSESALAILQRLRTNFGCRVVVWQDDVSQAEGVKRIIDKISEILPPLRGVIHAAGAIGKMALTELSPDHLTEILAPKVQGAWWLHEYTLDLNLDFFVVFSSVSSVWGSVGQAHYAAGNAFMDALMWSRRAQGLPGTSLNFGPWADGGMAEGELLRWLDANGIKPLSPLEALSGWQAVHGRVQTIIANVDWTRFASIYQARRRRPLLDQLVREAERPAKPNRRPLVRELEDAPAAQRRSALDRHVRRAVGQVLRMDPTDIDPQLGFFDLGMDSMTAVEFRQLLEQTLGCSLPATLAMDRPRLSEVVEYLLTDVLALDSKRAEPAMVNVGAPNESIAVIGLACRVPGAEGPEEFWHLLQTESDAIAEIPAERWDMKVYYDPDPEAPGKIYTRHAGLLDQIDQFDASLFGIAPREVASMDPQQRIILEVAWEALERAGIAPQILGQARTGVYLGASATEYANLIAAAGAEAIDAHFGTGTALNAIAGRLAFSLGLEGPALLIDTACSSSLVALHQACQALRSRECDLSLAGGVNLLLGPEGMMATCRARMLAPDGRCKTFDAAADGYVRGEGCGVVVLKRLSDAKGDRDRILAVIRGSAVNQDGASSGLTVPKGPAQERVIRQALRQAGIRPQEVVYLEAHGTGTSLGDPIEVQAAAAVLGQGRGADRPLLIGSVKTNIGHLEAAAGIVGLIKVILAMEHKVIPKHLHFQKPNPHIGWERLPVKVTSEATTWPVGRKIAGVSSFGFSGTNAHVIVEEAPEEQRIEKGESERSEHLLVLSARSEEALQQLAGRYVQWLEAKPEAELADVCYSAGVGRSHLGQRAAAVVNSFTEAKELLIKLERGESGGRLYRGQSSKRPKVAWLFTGQGSQYAGMGRELYRNQPVVREVLDRCQELLAQEGGRPLLEVLFEQEGLLNQTRYTQPALFALELALAELWRSWGQEPDVVLGHSVGQYAAAVVAGILSLEEGLRLVAKRGELMGQLPPGGAMAAVFSDLAGLEEVLGQEAELSLAADNGGHLVLSGTEEVLERVLLELRKAGVRSQRLNTSHGFHSKLMEPVLEEFESYARGVKFGTAKVGVVCNLTGDLLGATEASEPRYWRRHLRETVQFSRSIRTVAELGIELLVEVGPQPILLEIAQSCWPQSRPMALKVASMRRGQGEARQIAEAAAQLYVHGLTPDFVGWDRPWPRRKLSLPTYPFQRSRFWIKPRSERQSSAHGTSHQLLGIRNELASGEVVHRSEFGYVKHPWLIDHQLYQTVVVPGPAYVAMTFSAAGMPAEIRDVAFHEPLLLLDAREHDFQLLFSAPTALGERSFQYHSRPRLSDSVPWTQHASGVMRRLNPSAKPSPSSTPSVEQLQRRMQAWSVEQLYAYFSQRELQLGPTFRSIRAIWRGPTEALGQLVFAEPLIPYLHQEPIHPAVMDSCMHVVGAIPYDGSDSAEDIFYAPLHFGSVAFYQPVPSRFFCYATASRGIAAGAETRVYDLKFITPAGDLIGRVDGFTMKRASRKAFLRAVPSARDELLYHVEWRNHPAAEVWKRPSNDRWLIVTPDHAIGSQLAEKLRQRGQKCVLAIPGGVYRQLSDGCYEIPFAAEPEWERFLSEVGTAHEPLGGIIHICSSDAATVEPISARVIEKELHFNCGTLLAIVQTLIRRNRLPNRGLWIVTKGAQAAATPQSVIHSSLWGIGRVVQAEHPDLSCRLIDLDQPFTDASFGQLIQELDRETLETQVVLKTGHALVPRLVRLAPEQRKAVSFRHDATYLVTGGLGGLGLELARWLVQRGVRNLVLNGRSAPSQESLAVIAELRTLGARVEFFQGDVSKEEEVSDCLSHIHRFLPPLRGVFHLAGVARDGALAGQTWSQFGEVIAPKIQGAWNLHRLTLDQPMDCFVLFSSAAVLLGNPGQANYAAANAYLDALAHYRRRELGLPALSINWGPWSKVGLAARRADELSQRFHRTGLDWMNPQQALEALEDAMSRNEPSLGVMAIDWPTFAGRGDRNNVSPFFAELIDLPAKNETVQSASRHLNRVQDARSEERLSVLIDLVGQEVQQVLQTEQLPNPDAEFSTLGMDSLMAIELRNRLQRQIEAENPLPYALTFQYPNVKTVAQFLFEQLDQEQSPETVISTPLSDVRNDESATPQAGRFSAAQSADEISLTAATVNPSRIPRRSVAFEPVAVIGISGRFPGAHDLQSYWQNLAEGKSSITKYPHERSVTEKSQSGDLQSPGEKNFEEPWGGFLDGIDEFDAPFFKMARAEAEQLDPQHRLFLQEAWKALEDSGYSARELKGECCGIFVGAGASEYYAQISEPDAHTLTGNIGSGLTGRLAYLLDWTGPCLALDTACASSFSAIHLACTSLARGECDLALTGGVHVATSTKVFTSMTRMGLLSPSGRSRTFDAAADGWVLSEGVGAVILKRLEDAERDGDHIYGVLRGCGLNQDGAKNGLTSPKATAQTALQLRVYKEAGINPESIDYMEVHGLSSLLGDEIELFAMRQSFAPFTKEKGFCALGTLKPNIGHPFFAAGIASLIKVLLALKHRQIPPLIAPENVNEGLGLDASPFYLNTKLTEWKRRGGRPRRAAINGLSAIGTNCHLVVDEYVTEPATAGEASVRPALLFPLSARNEVSLRESASNFLKFLEDNPNLSLVDAAFTLQVGREAMEERLAFTAYSLEETKSKLSSYLREGGHTEVYRHRTEQIDSATALLVSGEEGRQFLTTAIGNRSLDKLALLWTKGIEIDWRLLYEDTRPRRVSLPAYPFARTRYWHPHLRTSDPVGPSQIGSRNERSDPKNGPSGALEFAIANSHSSPDGTAARQMTDLLRVIIAEVLRCSPQEIDPDRDLSLYGFDSLYVLRVVDQFNARTKRHLTPRIFFGCRTIRELVRKIGEQPSSDSVSSRSEKVLLQGPTNGDHFANGQSNGERRTANGERELGNALGRFRVSEGQKALWSIQQSHPTDAAYNLPIAVFWNEPIDCGILQQVLEQIVEEQPALRTSFFFESAELVQRVQGSVPFVVQQTDLGQFSEAEVIDHLNDLNNVPFNLARAPLWRVHAFSSSGGRSILLLNFHHLIFDGYSAGFLLEEIERRYRSIREGIRSERRVPQRGLADYITIERRYLSSEAFGQDRAYWLSQFPTGLPAKNISKDGADGEFNHRAGAVVQMPIGESLISALKHFAAAERVTLQAVCLAAFQMVLAVDGATEEVGAGVAVNVRPPEGFDELIGFFINILPIRAIVPGALSFRDFLQQIFNRLLEALEHRGFPFRQLVQAWTENCGTANELQAAFYFQTWNSAEQRRFADRFVPNIHQSGEFNLVFEVMEAPADWRLSVKYRPAFYSRARVKRLAEKFTAILSTITKNSESSLSRMLEENRSPTESGTFNYPGHRCAQELIEDQVAQRAQETAVIFRDQRLTYRELNDRANQLSHFLIRSGLQPGTLVGVMLERSLEMVIGLLAVWKAGAAYIPLDPTHPAERLDYILGDAGAEWLLTNSSCQFRTGTIRVIKVDVEEALIRRQPIAKPVVVSASDNLAYVIYTSGSTGDPKGVQITHRNLIHFLCSVAQRPGCTSDDYILACTTICFDIAALELFLPLVTGAQVEILSEEIVKNGLRLKEKIEGSPVTLVQATPATWKMLLAAELGRIPRVKALCGGEAWDVLLADQLLVRTRELWNMYGPTETTIWSSIQKVESGQPICLGDPIGNTQFYVFDETMKPVKPGQIGELFIGGDGLAKGYLNRPKLTRERFVPNPLCPEELIYRTGDLVRYV